MSNKPDRRVTCEIRLPEDHYAHEGAPTEWWWHTGTLLAEDGRRFGFEINATGGNKESDDSAAGFMQLAIIDLQNKYEYQKVKLIDPLPEDWAESDPKKPWYVRIGGSVGKGDDGAISMQAIDGNVKNMNVMADFMDSDTSTSCELSLQLRQRGDPLLVWGTGCREVDPNGETPLTRNNCYYSFTRLNADGCMRIGTEKFNVNGQTWMDHEYGIFPIPTPTEPVIWMLQDMQLSNNVHLSNYTKFDVKPEEGKKIKSYVTILSPDNKSTFVDSVTTPLAPTFKSKKGIVYFLKFKVTIDNPILQASFLVESLLPDQVFRDPIGADVYEGIAICNGRFNDTPVIGRAWIEENLG